MGIRVNSVIDFTPGVRAENGESAPRTANNPPNQPAPRPNITEMNVSPSSNGFSSAGIELPRIVSSPAQSSDTSSMPQRFDAPAGSEPSQPAPGEGLRGDSDQLSNADPAPPPRVRDFRYLTVAESAREREMESRHDQLERRLQSVTSRLKFADSLMVQIDARLERARLEQDLDMLSSQIRRLRLETAFQRPSVVAPPADDSEPERLAAAVSVSNRSPADSEAVLNLLA